ncbi:MAG: ferredoxin [Thermodesulfobacteriaceae bacterium]|nr:ferredoxin [Thermodesulfobacteriaceae bacterium]
MATLTIDEELCIGCGTCVEICPEVFRLGDDEKAYVYNQEGCNSCNCEEAINSCPVRAISWQE